MNEVLKHKIQIINDERIKYEDYYKIFNTLRTVIALAVCPILEMFEIFIITWDWESFSHKKRLPGLGWSSSAGLMVLAQSGRDVYQQRWLRDMTFRIFYYQLHQKISKMSIFFSKRDYRLKVPRNLEVFFEHEKASLRMWVEDASSFDSSNIIRLHNVKIFKLKLTK